MKKCILCGKTHDGACDRTGWDSIFSGKVNIPQAVTYIEDKALEEQERQHISKKRGRKPKNG